MEQKEPPAWVTIEAGKGELGCTASMPNAQADWGNWFWVHNGDTIV